MSLPTDHLDLPTDQLHDALGTLQSELLAQRNEAGHWVGQLSSSALATATAVSALSIYRAKSRRPAYEPSVIERLIDRGLDWIRHEQNDDGGWGDTRFSHSNIATTMLTVAAITLANRREELGDQIQSAHTYIQDHGGIEGLRKRYGIDKTFAVPILANCAIAGIVPWKEVAALPFEAALVPQSWYRFLQLPVVSYAIPALVGIGQAKFLADPPRNPLTRWFRTLAKGPGLKVLRKMQPSSGGYLEAIPLTSFVVMSLADSGRADHAVTHAGVQFIVESFRDLGSTGTWPIDTNLATWNTTLSINALCSSKTVPSGVLTDELLDWLLNCQYDEVHPFTGAKPGGWGWSDLSGSVPDADDTPSALLAIRHWLVHRKGTDHQRQRIMSAASNGVNWLMALQNRDRGWPTFCRGWGKLPFDRSGSDITAHVIRALVAWRDPLPNQAIGPAIESGFDYLQRNQRADGSWLPLWFGNQDQLDEINPVYGTAKVLLAYRDANRLDTLPAQRGLRWMAENQNEDGGWGGGRSIARTTSAEKHKISGGPRTGEWVLSSLQETSLALEALANDFDDPSLISAREAGLKWVLSALKTGNWQEKWPIGFYFAKLWYYERLYPLIYATSALTRIHELKEVESAVARKS